MVKEGTWIFYKKCLHATVIVPIEVICWDTSLKTKIQCSKGGYETQSGLSSHLCYGLTTGWRYIKHCCWIFFYTIHHISLLTMGNIQTHDDCANRSSPHLYPSNITWNECYWYLGTYRVPFSAASRAVGLNQTVPKRFEAIHRALWRRFLIGDRNLLYGIWKYKLLKSTYFKDANKEAENIRYCIYQ